MNFGVVGGNSPVGRNWRFAGLGILFSISATAAVAQTNVS